MVLNQYRNEKMEHDYHAVNTIIKIPSMMQYVKEYKKEKKNATPVDIYLDYCQKYSEHNIDKKPIKILYYELTEEDSFMINPIADHRERLNRTQSCQIQTQIVCVNKRQ